MQKHKCSLCGQEYTKNEKFKNEYLILEAISKHNTLEYIDSLLEICPKCGVVKRNIDGFLTKDLKCKFDNIISSNEYFKVLNSDISVIEKKIMLHEMLVKSGADIVEIYPNIDYIKWLYYDFINDIENAKIYYNKAKEYLINEINADVGDVPPTTTKQKVTLTVNMQYNLYLADMYRQNKEFDKALKILKQYDKFNFDEDETLEQDWFKKEIKMCKDKNSNKL